MTYAVDILRTAQKQLAKLDRQAQVRINDAINKLAFDPRPASCKKLSGRPAWRIRVGSYRIIYEIHDSKLLVLVVSIGDRKNIYR
ncbi:MAG: type II toxin-antitoxin system RelE/ParE family toxin [Kiritimatiellae bacterium]|jgi:mRNA interferase RelE/StbE|nr:type II toxin-antitoxin system RelE/ParE family toxin [Kiritimatiellia bacterium]